MNLLGKTENFDISKIETLEEVISIGKSIFPQMSEPLIKVFFESGSNFYFSSYNKQNPPIESLLDIPHGKNFFLALTDGKNKNKLRTHKFFLGDGCEPSPSQAKEILDFLKKKKKFIHNEISLKLIER